MTTILILMLTKFKLTIIDIIINVWYVKSSKNSNNCYIFIYNCSNMGTRLRNEILH